MATNETGKQLIGHQGAIYDAVWDKRHERWLTAGGDGVVAGWDEEGAEDGQAVLHHEHAIYCVLPFVNGIAAGVQNGDLMLLYDGEKVRRIAAHPGGVFSLYMTSDHLLYSGGADGAVRCWKEGELVGEWEWPGAGKIRTLAATDHGLFVGAGSGEGWVFDPKNPTTPNERAPISYHEGGIYAALWVPDKQVWITGGKDGYIRVNLQNGNPVFSFSAHQGAIYRMVMDSNTLYTASRDKSVKSWDLASLSPQSRWDSKNKGATRSVNALALGGTNSDWILAAGDDRKARLRNVSDWSPLDA